MKTKLFLFLSLLVVLSVRTEAQTQLWVGEKYQCFLTDYANTYLTISNIIWTIPSEMNEEYSGTYVRTVSFEQYQNDTYNVRASWKETDLGDPFSPFYNKSHLWSFTCRDNPLLLNSSSLTLTKGSSGTIGYSHTYNNEYTSLAKVTFSSNNSSVASVSSTGVVTAKGTGTATITVTSTIAKDAKTCTVTVKSTPSGIQFADAKVKALCVANWDTNGDGELSLTEAAAVTDLGKVFSENTEITSFKELQYFTGLTSIGDYAFDDCEGLTSITIPNSVTSIGESAFMYCSSLTSVTIPNSVTSIGIQAFMYCSSLTSVNIPKSVTSIDLNTFSGCSSLTSITIPNSVTSIGESALRDCSSLTSVTIPNSVTYIGSLAFEGCSGLISIVVESGNTTYDSRNNCKAIIETSTNTLIAGCMNTVIPKSVTSIGGYAFSECTGLTSITIPESVTSIGHWAFSGCSGLTSVTIPNSVTSIGNGAFDRTAWYKNLPNGLVYAGKVAYKYKGTMPQGTEIVIKDGTLEIAFNAFRNCSGLTSVTIPNSVTSIGSSAFNGCSGLTSVTIPNSVTSIGDWAFEGCSGLTSVTIPNSVTIIGSWAFEGCSSLTSITIPENVTSIYYSAFKGCSGLTSVTIPEGVTSIGNYAFEDCRSLTSVTIPNSVTSIGSSAFDGCWELTSVHITDLAAWCNISFGYKPFPLYYARHLYMNGEEIKDLVIPNSVTSIGSFAFETCTGLTSVTIPEGVTSIGNYAFYNCSGLTSVTIPEGVTSIGSFAFDGCWKLTTVTIGSSVTSIGFDVFNGCSGLTDVYCYAENVPTTYSSAFNNSPIASVTLHVPAGSVEAYSTTAPWSDFGMIVAIDDVTLGDLNGDGKVSITDVVLIIDVIAGDITDADKVAAADVNGDGKVSITDCVEAIDLIATQASSPSSAKRKANAMLTDTDFISATMQDDGLLCVNLEGERRYTAFQMTVSVPEDMTLGRATMDAQRGASHQVLIRDLGNGQYLVAGFSADNEELMASSGRLLSIVTEGQADADIVISDIEFASTQAEAYHLADAAVSSTPTGLNEMKNEELRMKNEIYDLQGRRVKKAAKGIYINNGKKTIIK